MPTEIYTVEDLAAVGASGDFILMNDLDFADDASYADPANKATHYDGTGWLPICNDPLLSFSGTFDGQNHRLVNLRISRDGVIDQGLFGHALGGVIKNLHIWTGSIACGDRSGVLVGWSGSNEVTNCTANGGQITATGDAVGGLIGHSAGDTISRCGSSTHVQASGGEVGGLIGDSTSSVTESYAFNNVTGGGGFVGGFFGVQGPGLSGGVTTRCLSWGHTKITATGAVGGFVGYSEGFISNCLATGLVESTVTTGTIAGFIDSNGPAANVSFSLARVDIEVPSGYSSGNISGFVHTDHNGTMTGDGCFWDTSRAGTTTSAFGVGKTSAELRGLIHYVNGGWDVTQCGFSQKDSSYVWNQAGITSYPTLSWFIPEKIAWAHSGNSIYWQLDDKPWGILTSGISHDVVKCSGETFGTTAFILYDENVDYQVWLWDGSELADLGATTAYVDPGLTIGFCSTVKSGEHKIYAAGAESVGQIFDPLNDTKTSMTVGSTDTVNIREIVAAYFGETVGIYAVGAYTDTIALVDKTRLVELSGSEWVDVAGYYEVKDDFQAICADGHSLSGPDQFAIAGPENNFLVYQDVLEQWETKVAMPFGAAETWENLAAQPAAIWVVGARYETPNIPRLGRWNVATGNFTEGYGIAPGVYTSTTTPSCTRLRDVALFEVDEGAWLVGQAGTAGYLAYHSGTAVEEELVIPEILLSASSALTEELHIVTVNPDSVVVRDPEDVAANGLAASTVTVTLVDTESDPMVGLVNADFNIQVTGSASAGTVIEVSAGVYEFEVTNTVMEVVTVTVTVLDVGLNTQPTINFLDELTVQYSATAGGSILGDANQVVLYGKDAEEVTADPDTGYDFASWSDAHPTAVRQDTSVTGNIDAVASFELTVSPVDPTNSTVEAAPNTGVPGNGTAVSEVTVVLRDGDNNLLDAVALSDFSINLTGGAAIHSNLSNDGLGVYTFDVTNDFASGTQTITVNVTVEGVLLGAQPTIGFLAEYTLQYSAGVGGSLTGSTNQTVLHGTSGTQVTASADPGYSFNQWSDGVTTASRTDQDANINVTATFSGLSYSVTYNAGPNGSIDGDTNQTVNWGEDATPVEAIPDPGYDFASWSDAHPTASRHDLNIQSTLSVTASFGQMVPDATASTVQGNPLILLADGIQTSTVTVTVLDAGSNPIPGLVNTDFNIGIVGTATASDVTESATPGVYTFTVSSTTVNEVTVTVEVLTVVLDDTVELEFIPAVSLSLSTIEVVPTEVAADETTTAIITVTLRDVYNVLLPGYPDMLHPDLGPNVITSEITDHMDGTYTFTARNLTVEMVTVNVEIVYPEVI